MIVSPNGSQMTQGQSVLVWGATGGIGAYACQYVMNGGGTPVGVVSSREARRRCCTSSASRRSSTARRGLQVLERRRHRAGPGRVAAVRQEDPRARRARRRHRVRAPRPLDDGRVGVRRQARRDDHHVRGDERLHDRVRQPLPLDEPQDAEGLPLRELPRGVGGEPARSCEAQGPPDAVEGVPARGHRRGRVRRCTTTCARASSASCASRPRKASASPTRRRASSTSTRSPCSAVWRSDGPDGRPWTCCSPRSTTSPSPSTTSRPRSTYYRETFGCEVEHREVVESDGVEEALLKVADSYVQLLTPTRPDSPVAKYLEKKGEGLHHIGYRVADCARGARVGEGAAVTG